MRLQRQLIELREYNHNGLINCNTSTVYLNIVNRAEIMFSWKKVFFGNIFKGSGHLSI